jgi:hypothetical protein
LVRDNNPGMVPLAHHVLGDHGLLSGSAGRRLQQVLGPQKIGEVDGLNDELAAMHVVRVSNAHGKFAEEVDRRIQEEGRISVFHPTMPRLSSSVSSMSNHRLKTAILSPSVVHISTT